MKNELCGEMFEPLRDLKYYKSLRLKPFPIEWENGADFSPEFLYVSGKSVSRQDEMQHHV